MYLDNHTISKYITSATFLPADPDCSSGSGLGGDETMLAYEFSWGQIVQSLILNQIKLYSLLEGGIKEIAWHRSVFFFYSVIKTPLLRPILLSGA